MLSAEVGTVIGPVLVTPSRESLVRYAAASQDFAPLHYDQEYAQSRGFPAVLVHGMLKAGYLGSLLRDWAGQNAEIRRWSMRYLKPDFPDSPLTCRGLVTEVEVVNHGHLLHVDLWVENQLAERTVTGEATTYVPAESGK